MVHKNKDFHKRKVFKNTDLSNKVRDLMRKYNMDEPTALEISMGVVPLDLWLEKRKINEENVKANQTFEDDLMKFTPNGKLCLSNASIILKKIFSLEQYSEENNKFVELEEEAAALAKKHDMSIPVAKSILAKKFTLEEYISGKEEKNKRKQQALLIKKQHPNIALETCYKLVDDNIEAEEYLEKQTQKEEKRGMWYKNYLQDRSEDNELLNNYLAKLRKSRSTVAFHLYGMKSMVGIIHSYTPYEIKVICNRKPILLSKLDVKYFCRSRNNEETLKIISINRDLQKNPVIPSKNPQDRYSIPKLSNGQKIEITMGEGEKIIGYVDWLSKFDLKIKLQPRSNLSAMIFNHAIVNITVLENEQ